MLSVWRFALGLNASKSLEENTVDNNDKKVARLSVCESISRTEIKNADLEKSLSNSDSKNV